MNNDFLPPKHNMLVLRLFAGTLLIWTVLALLIGILIHAVVVLAIMGVAFGIGYWLLASSASEKFVIDVHDGELLDASQAPKLYESVRELAEIAGVESPVIYVLPNQRPNAFVVSRRGRSPIIGVTRGLTEFLERDEVTAVMAILIARVASGAALAWTVSSALSGIPLHIAEDRSEDDLAPEPPKQSTLRVLLCPLFTLYTRFVSDADAVRECDTFAGVLLGDPAVVARAIGRLAEHRQQLNPSVSPIYAATAQVFATPFYAEPELEDWQTRALNEAAREVPRLVERVENIGGSNFALEA